MSDNQLYQRLMAAILEANLPDQTARFAEAAWHGEDAVAAVVESATYAARPPSLGGGPARRAYLQEISVRGFRGIGRELKMHVPPGNGLTVVLGRNGSGKSSVAEGLEMLVTGENARWNRKKTKVWSEAWKNLHGEDAPRLSAQFAVDGHDGPVVLRRTWSSERLDSDELTVLPGGSLETLGWAQALETYRPFLPYAELEGWAESSTAIFDTVNAVLGIDALDEAAGALDKVRKRLVDEQKQAKTARARLAERAADGDDPRLARVRAALAKRTADTGALEALLTEPVEAEGPVAQLRRLATLASPKRDSVHATATRLRAACDAVAAQPDDAAAFLDTAELMRRAVAWFDAHADAPCPVCGGAQLDLAWRQQAQTRVEDLSARASSAAAARRELDTALREGRGLIGRMETGEVPTEIDAAVDELRTAYAAWAPPELAEMGAAALAHHLETHYEGLDAAVGLVREEARVALSAHASVWRPVVKPLADFLEIQGQVAAHKETLAAVVAARKFVQEVAAQVRAERFAPIADDARSLWEQLRAGSSVDLVDIAIEGKGTGRKINLSIQVDDKPAPALGVMSQGELNALALSLFLPRACMDTSPFGFVVIDDPVQSMDPARVDGLAQVLARTAAQRQVIVFTHDDRLTEALRRLQIPANVLWVERDHGSNVSVAPHFDPVTLYLEDARAVAYSAAEVGDDVVVRVVPGLCRLAIEAAISTAVRRNMLGRGVPHVDVDDALRKAHKLRQKAAILFFDDASRAGEVGAKLKNMCGRPGAEAFAAANRGAHTGELAVDPKRFVNDCETVANKLWAYK